MQIFRHIFFLLFFLNSFAHTEEVRNTDLGRSRVLEIMFQGPHGIKESYKNCTFAHTKNMTMDLNLQAAVDRLPLQTLGGKNFLCDALDDKLLSSQDTTSLLYNRQHALKVISKNPQLKKQLSALLQDAALYEIEFIEFMQKKQDALDRLPKGYLGKLCAQSKIVQAYKQISLAIPTAICAYTLYKIAPYYQYFYKKPADLIKDKKETDFISLEDWESVIKTKATQDLAENLTDFSWKNSFTCLNLGYKAAVTPEAKNLLKKIPDTVAKKYVVMQDSLAEEQAVFDKRDQQLANNEVQLKKNEWLGEYFSDDNFYKEPQIYFPSYDAVKQNFAKNKLYTDRFILGLYAGAYVFVGELAYMTSSYGYQMYKVHLEGLKLRDALHAIHKLIVIAEEIELLCKRYGIRMQCAMSAIEDQTPLELLSTLKSYPYNSKDHAFVPSCATRTFMYQVYEQDMQLAPVLACIAEMDALHAFATKIVETKTTPHKFCLAEFFDSSLPQIHAIDYWNFLVHKPVCNSISEHRKIILTGPNAGGKSTTIRALLQNIVLAQTFGVAAAQEFALTPFDMVHSFINVSDDILNGKSLFATEVARACEILTCVKKLAPDEKYFFALDELFTGTNAEDGEMCAYKFIENIANFAQVQFVYATHFNKLKEFGCSHETCVNYKIDAPLQNQDGQFIRDSKGKLCYPYTLTPGANNISVAKEIAYDAGLF